VVWSDQDKSVYECVPTLFSLLTLPNTIDRSLIPEYFPPGDMVKDSEPTAAISESDGSDTPAPT